MNKKPIKFILFISVIVFAILIMITFNIGTFYNDSVLNSFSKQLYYCKLPEGTVIIEKQNICGKLNGNGDGMDFLACILITSDKTIDDLEKYFDSINFKGAKSSSKTAKLQVITITNNNLHTEYLEHREIIFNEPIRINDFKYYAVIIYDGGYWNFLDFRGA